MTTNLEKAQSQLQKKLNEVGITLEPSSLINRMLNLAATPDSIIKGKLKSDSLKLENGVYILYDDILYTLEDWKSQEPDITIANQVVLVTDYCNLLIDKNIIGSMTYDEAISNPLPDRIQGVLIGSHRNILKPVIEEIGGEWSDSWFWTKSEYNSYCAWSYYGYGGGLDTYRKRNSFNVRPVSAFIPKL